jgi:Fur family transcriptional regulator, ferric uptake regulator
MKDPTTPGKRLNRKARIFNILHSEPWLNAAQLQEKARQVGLDLSPVAAYRSLKLFRDTRGQLERSERQCFQVAVTILENALPGEHLSAKEIMVKAAGEGNAVQRATVYRVLQRLWSLGLVTILTRGRERFYEWRREEKPHGHLTCISCKETIEFYQGFLEDLARQVCSGVDYDFVRVEFVVHSLCPRCRDK